MTDPSPRSASMADTTREYIDEHASIREALKDDIVNFTALARKIQAERDLPNEEAVTIACRRYQRGLVQASAAEAAIRAIVSSSRLQVQSRVALVRIRDDWEIVDRLLEVGRTALPGHAPRRVFQLFQGTQAITILCEEDFLSTLLPEIPARARVAVERGLAVLAFRSRPDVAETPGVVSHMVDALYRRGINCLETVSVHTDSIFVFRDQDVIRAYQALSGLLEPDHAEPPPTPSASRGQQS